MDWAAVINNPFLKNLPFKIELNKWGQILMSPAGNNHGRLQFNVGDKIKTGKNGRGQVIMECSIQTSQGVRVADVAWSSDEFIKENGFAPRIQSLRKFVWKSLSLEFKGRNRRKN